MPIPSDRANRPTTSGKSGYYLSLGERDPDVAGLSVPVLGLEDELLGAVSLSGLRVRFNETTVDGYRAAVFDAARQIRAEIGDDVKNASFVIILSVANQLNADERCDRHNNQAGRDCGNCRIKLIPQ